MFHLNRYLPYSIELSFTFHTLRVGIQSYMCEMCLDVVLLADQIKAFVFCKKKNSYHLKVCQKASEEIQIGNFLERVATSSCKISTVSKKFLPAKLLVSLGETDGFTGRNFLKLFIFLSRVLFVFFLFSFLLFSCSP